MADRVDWPIYIRDRQGNRIYITQERWEHALDHPGMHENLLDEVLRAIQQGDSKRDAYDPAKMKYSIEIPDHPMPYTHIVVVVKFGWHGRPAQENNFVLTAYLVEKW